MQKYLVVSALIENSSKIIRTFSKLPESSGCNIVDSQFKVLGHQLSLMLFLSGSWDSIAKIEAMLANLEQQHDIKILTNRTEVESLQGDTMPYAIDVVGIDQTRIIYDIANFMLSNDLRIQEMASHTYEASHTAAKMFSLHMLVSIPLDTSIAGMRGDFIEFCDRLNLDAIMEPVK
ncbi:MAG TPA: glycine cleavage system protein R [Thiotrichaceae bacterium]|jgi:glycine cleavage system transcriptional repressor|nr:glycine cleavage system protein R [Thiotrichaceae bacterium]HIM09020.1 glycine cleavage system protein R [Gammaproteobacteria bacterium]